MSLSDLYYQKLRAIDREIDLRIFSRQELIAYLVSILLWAGWCACLIGQVFYTVGLPIYSLTATLAVVIGFLLSIGPTLVLIHWVVSPVGNERLRRLGWKGNDSHWNGPTTRLQRIFVFRVMAQLWEPFVISVVASDAEVELARRQRLVGNLFEFTNSFFPAMGSAIWAFVQTVHLSTSIFYTGFILCFYTWLLCVLLIGMFSGEYVAPFRQYLSSLRIIQTRHDLSFSRANPQITRGG
jgi:hypothetical protein